MQGGDERNLFPLLIGEDGGGFETKLSFQWEQLFFLEPKKKIVQLTRSDLNLNLRSTRKTKTLKNSGEGFECFFYF